MNRRIRIPKATAAGAAAAVLLPALLLAGAPAALAAETGTLTLTPQSPLSASGWHTGPGETELRWEATAPDGADLTAIEYSYASTGGTASTATGVIGLTREGETTVEAVASFSDGSTASTSTVVRRDTSAPEASVAWGPVDGGVYDHGTEFTLDLACADPESGVVSCRLAGRANGETVTLWESGDIVWTLEAVNGAGVTTSVPVAFTVRPDVTAPGLRYDVYGDETGGWFTGPVSVVASAWDLSGTRGVWSRVDGGAESNSGAGYAGVDVTTDGEHLVEFWVFDAAGNRSDTRAVPVRIDTTAPRVELPAATRELRRGATVTLDAVCRDDVAGVATSGVVACEGILDGTTAIAPGDALPTADLGRHEIVLTATDAAGHRSSSVTLVYTVVADAPAGRVETLAVTGAGDVAVPAALAVLALVAGAGALTFRRRATR